MRVMEVEMDGWMEVGDRNGHLWGAADVETPPGPARCWRLVGSGKNRQ